MYQCKEGHISEPHELLNKIVTKFRDKIYINDGKQTTGWEIIEESWYCTKHAEKVTNITPPRQILSKRTKQINSMRNVLIDNAIDDNDPDYFF